MLVRRGTKRETRGGVVAGRTLWKFENCSLQCKIENKVARLFTTHPLSLQTEYSELKRLAQEQHSVFVGTPGSVTIRTVTGRGFYYRQYYDPNGKKAADYIGPVGADEAERAAQTTSERIEEANALLARARILARAGYARVDSRTDAILSALFDNGLFEAGTVLVGSHAYGALLNELGVRAAGYATNDVDLARPRSLALPELRSFEEMLKDSGLELLPVSQFGKKPPTSFKPAGADPLRIDLLAPTRRTSIGVLAIPELSAHATALPHFAWLLEHVEHSVVLGKSSVIPVNVPRPEIFAWHKMVLSQLRSRSRDKVQKDRMQAAVLFAALAALEPSALEASYSGLSRPTRSLVKASARHVAERLMTSKHESAAALLQELAG